MSNIWTFSTRSLCSLIIVVTIYFTRQCITDKLKMLLPISNICNFSARSQYEGGSRSFVFDALFFLKDPESFQFLSHSITPCLIIYFTKMHHETSTRYGSVVPNPMTHFSSDFTTFSNPCLLVNGPPGHTDLIFSRSHIYHVIVWVA